MTIPVRLPRSAREVQELTLSDFEVHQFLVNPIVGKVIEVKGEAFLLKALQTKSNEKAFFSAKKLIFLDTDRFAESVEYYAIKFFNWSMRGEADKNFNVLRCFPQYGVRVPDVINFSLIGNVSLLVTKGFMTNLKDYKPTNRIVNIYHAKFLIEDLNRIHGLDCVHCGLSPSNLLIGRDSKGMIKRAIGGFEETFHISNLPDQFRVRDLSYAAPESLFSNSIKFNRATDLFSMGLTLFYILTGRCLWGIGLDTIGDSNIENGISSEKELAEQMLLFLGSPPESFIDLGNGEWQKMALAMGSEAKGYQEVREDLSKLVSHFLKKRYKGASELVNVMAACLIWDPQERVERYDSIFPIV